MTPKTRYARNGDVSLAYQVFGEGPIDLVLIPGTYGHLELAWTEPATAWFYERLAEFSRVIIFDKRGTGMSDRDVGVAPLEERMDDVRAVMDAAGSYRAVVQGLSEGGAMAILFAATHPERTSHLVLYGTIPRVTAAPDWPGIPEEEYQSSIEEAVAKFPDLEDIEVLAPSLAEDPAARDRWTAMTRLGASPGSLRALLTMIGQIDVRAVLPTISVPTLVLHRRDDQAVPFACSQYLASQIPNSKLVPLPGADHYICGDLEPWVGAVEEFVTGTRHEAVPDRILATVVFTDIVGSTDLAARLGDSAWHRLLDQHDVTLRAMSGRYSGRVVKTLGDGGLITFDGPARAARFAAAFGAAMATLGLSVRAGIHTGEVELRGEDLGGLAVHIAARISGLAGPGEVLSSRTVKDLTAGSDLHFENRGMQHLKGVPEDWQVFAVT